MKSEEEFIVQSLSETKEEKIIFKKSPRQAIQEC